MPQINMFAKIRIFPLISKWHIMNTIITPTNITHIPVKKGRSFDNISAILF